MMMSKHCSSIDNIDYFLYISSFGHIKTTLPFCLNTCQIYMGPALLLCRTRCYTIKKSFLQHSHLATKLESHPEFRSQNKTQWTNTVIQP